MADAADSKSATRECVRVRVPPSAVHKGLNTIDVVREVHPTRETIVKFLHSLPSLFFIILHSGDYQINGSLTSEKYVTADYPTYGSLSSQNTARQII